MVYSRQDLSKVDNPCLLDFEIEVEEGEGLLHLSPCPRSEGKRLRVNLLQSTNFCDNCCWSTASAFDGLLLLPDVRSLLSEALLMSFTQGLLENYTGDLLSQVHELEGIERHLADSRPNTRAWHAELREKLTLSQTSLWDMLSSPGQKASSVAYAAQHKSHNWWHLLDKHKVDKGLGMDQGLLMLLDWVGSNPGPIHEQVAAFIGTHSPVGIPATPHRAYMPGEDFAEYVREVQALHVQKEVSAYLLQHRTEPTTEDLREELALLVTYERLGRVPGRLALPYQGNLDNKRLIQAPRIVLDTIDRLSPGGIVDRAEPVDNIVFDTMLLLWNPEDKALGSLKTLREAATLIC